MTTLFDFLVEILAVFLGVVFAFLFDEYREGRDERKEGRKVLDLLRFEVEGNKNILEPMKDTAVGAVPNSRPMRGIWDGLTAKLGTVKNDEILSELGLLYFLQAALDRALNVYRHYAGEYQYADPEKKAAMLLSITSERDHFVNYITTFVLPQIVKVIALIDAELGDRKPKTEEKGVP
ncbi:MAG: hypothetical protein ABSD99_12905 [Candidatus Bathyarchaeia archaeon]